MATIDSFCVKDVSRVTKSQEEEGSQEWQIEPVSSVPAPDCTSVCVCLCVRAGH